ncbi:MAG: hypothetical protein ACK2UO_00110 [Caldilineaceae bacterium]
MFRRLGISLIIAVALMALLVASVGAQSTVGDEDTPAASIVPMGGGIVQAIPLTLTVNVPGPDGPVSVEVPIVLSLDIQIALGNVLTSSVVVTAETAITEVAEVVAATPTVVAATATPTAVPPTPTPVPPTAVPAEPTSAPTQAAPTPAPVGETAEPTAAPEAESTATGEEATAEPGEGETAEGEAQATPEPAPIAETGEDNCSDPRAVIYAPTAGEVISGTVDVFGTARHELFDYYKLEYQQVGGESGDFAFITDSASPVSDGTLAELDTTELDNGDYVLRLTVVDNTGNFPPQCSVPVRIAN